MGTSCPGDGSKPGKEVKRSSAGAQGPAGGGPPGPLSHHEERGLPARILPAVSEYVTATEGAGLGLHWRRLRPPCAGLTADRRCPPAVLAPCLPAVHLLPCLSSWSLLPAFSSPIHPYQPFISLSSAPSPCPPFSPNGCFPRLHHCLSPQIAAGDVSPSSPGPQDSWTALVLGPALSVGWQSLAILPGIGE